MQKVTITVGSYRNQPINDVEAILMRPIKLGAKGWFGNFQIEGLGNVRVQLPSEDSVVYHGSADSPSPEEELTDQQIMDRIEDRFKILAEVTGGVAASEVRSLIVSGAPGCGKSVGIQTILDEHSSKFGIEYTKISGNIVSAFQLYQTLYENSDEHTVLILDDCDGLLYDFNCINMFKAALESGDRPRILSYQSKAIVDAGLPTSFEFCGQVIFITNVDFQKVIDKEVNISKHLAALVDRSLYLDLTMHTKREIYCRIVSMVKKGMLNQHGLTDNQIEQLLEYTKERMHDLRSLSLRTVVQLAQFMKTSPKGWRRMSEAFQIASRS